MLRRLIMWGPDKVPDTAIAIMAAVIFYMQGPEASAKFLRDAWARWAEVEGRQGNGI